MPGIEIKGRSKIANYRHGGRTGKFGGGRTNLLEQLGRVEAEPSNPNRRAEISRVHGELNRGYAKGGRAGFAHGLSTLVRKTKKVMKEHLARTEAKQVQAAKDKIQKSEMGYAKGGRAGFKHGTPGPKIGHSLKEKTDPRGKFFRDKKRAKEKVVVDSGKRKAAGGWTLKEWLKDKKPKKYLGRPFMKIKKEKDWADPSETVGGRRIQTKGGPELIPPKRKDDVGVGGYQVPEKDLPSRSKMFKKSQGLKEGGRIGFKKGTDKKWIQKAVDPKHKGYCTPMTKKTCTPARKALARTFKKKAKTGWG